MQTSLPFDYQYIEKINEFGEREDLYRKFQSKLILNPDLNRGVVSHQADKSEPCYRWFKYKEAFSSRLVRYVLDKFAKDRPDNTKVLDPFAGIGTTLIAAAENGYFSTGIEILPVGTAVIKARIAANKVNLNVFRRSLKELERFSFADNYSEELRFPHIPITENAFPEENEQNLSAYRCFLSFINDEDVHYLFWFACLSILEDVSYTRKDGQYLRWDHRSGKSSKSLFDKGKIFDFRPRILEKLNTIYKDIANYKRFIDTDRVKIIEGSCLTELLSIPDGCIDFVITSPPYCNRYDYTRTYALELAFMGLSNDRIKNLRQELLSSTVENKSKKAYLLATYKSAGNDSLLRKADEVFSAQRALAEVLALLYEAKRKGTLNNNNIPGMVENYFYEMCIIIFELARMCKPGCYLVMVNDNVQYSNEEIPVDLILSDFAEKAGLRVDGIWILPKGKGNSSQQMGAFGRKEIRKCVYVWQKPLDS